MPLIRETRGLTICSLLSGGGRRHRNEIQLLAVKFSTNGDVVVHLQTSRLFTPEWGLNIPFLLSPEDFESLLMISSHPSVMEMIPSFHRLLFQRF